MPNNEHETFELENQCGIDASRLAQRIAANSGQSPGTIELASATAIGTVAAIMTAKRVGGL